MSKGAWICAAATIRNLGVLLAATTAPGILASLHESIIKRTADALALSDLPRSLPTSRASCCRPTLARSTSSGTCNIISILLAATAVLLPSTLLANICGMNCHFMPELHRPYEYPLALLIVLVSTVVPCVVFHRMSWLQAAYRHLDGS